MSIYEEKQPKLWIAVLILITCFICAFPLWRMDAEQLTSNEGQYAVAVSELHSMQTYVTLHGQPSQEIMPLYPLLAKCIYSAGVSIEFALRFVSFLSLALISLMTGLICGSIYNRQSGVVAALVVFSSYLALFHASDGYPYTTIALLLYSGWMLWFYLGYMRTRWNIALLMVGLVSVMAFFLGGRFAMLCFLIPMAFLERPFKLWSHIRSKGFFTALALIFIGILLWRIPLQNALAGNPLDSSEEIRISSMISHFFLYPFQMFCELLPWSLLIWLPFCPLLFCIEEKPLFMKYHRILLVVLLLLLWITPGTEAGDAIYMIPLCATLIASDYRIFVRRYSAQCFQTTIACAVFSLIWIILLFLQLQFPSASLVSTCITPLSRIIWHFRPDTASTLKIAYIISGLCAILLAVYAIYLARKKYLPWVLWCLVFLSFAIPYHEIVIPEKSMAREKEALGRKIRVAIDQNKGDAQYIFKDASISGLYAECFYIGLPVILTNQGIISDSTQNTVFLLTAGSTALDTSKSWTTLLTETYRGKNLYLYMGKKLPEEEKIIYDE